MSKNFNANVLVEAVKQCLPDGLRPIGLHEPCFAGNEWIYVKECLDSGWVSSVGKFVDRFEQQLADYTGVKRAVAVVNGTAALHVSLLLCGVKPQDEVVVPALTFVATANAVTYCGAVPHFADSSLETLGLDVAKLRDYLAQVVEIRDGASINRLTGRRIKAVVPMHTFGHPVDLDSLCDLCEQYNLALIEDAAESLGSYYKGRHTGNWGRVAALSFNGNKTITTGGGGAILTNDEELGKLAKHLTTTAKVAHGWEFFHDMVGYNYRLPNINAALGCAQMEVLESYIEKKRSLAKKYQCALAGVPGVSFVAEPPDTRSNYWLNSILLTEPSVEIRNQIIGQFNDAGIMARPAWTLMSKLPMYTLCPKMELATAEAIEQRLINLPSSVFL